MSKKLTKKLKNGIVETIKIEGAGMTIGCAICCLILVLMGLELLAIMYIFVTVTFVSLLAFIAAAVFFILLNEHYEIKQLKSGIIS